MHKEILLHKPDDRRNSSSKVLLASEMFPKQMGLKKDEQSTWSIYLKFKDDIITYDSSHFPSLSNGMKYLFEFM